MKEGGKVIQELVWVRGRYRGLVLVAGWTGLMWQSGLVAWRTRDQMRENRFQRSSSFALSTGRVPSFW